MTPDCRILRLAPLLVLLAGCDIFDPGDCVAIGRFALNVIVKDSLTGGPPPTETRVIAREGEYADTLSMGIPNAAGTSFPLAVERTGSYVVTVEAPGYRTWSKANVVVKRSSGHCSELQTVTVLARLQR